MAGAFFLACMLLIIWLVPRSEGKPGAGGPSGGSFDEAAAVGCGKLSCREPLPWSIGCRAAEVAVTVYNLHIFDSRLPSACVAGGESPGEWWFRVLIISMWAASHSFRRWETQVRTQRRQVVLEDARQRFVDLEAGVPQRRQ
jgi:hypothetical protein